MVFLVGVPVVAFELVLFRIFSVATFPRALAAVLGLLVLLVGPTAWSLTPLMNSDPELPHAGPDLLSWPASGSVVTSDATLIAYLNANRGGAKYLVATVNASAAEPIILQTGAPVVALGGFSGADPILTPTGLAARIAAHEVRLFLIPSQGRQTIQTQWVAKNCSRAAYATPSSPQSEQRVPFVQGGQESLYRCGSG